MKGPKPRRSGIRSVAGRLYRRVLPGYSYRKGLEWSAQVYDMYENPGEKFYAQIYDYWINRTLGSQLEKSLKVLDAGCQSGRFAIPLALKGHRVTALDISRTAIAKAKNHAESVGASGIDFLIRDLADGLDDIEPRHFDLVMCIEVIHAVRKFGEVLRELVGLVDQGGYLAVTFRPMRYYMLKALLDGDTSLAERVMAETEYEFSYGYRNWTTANRAESALGSLGLEIRSTVGIGTVSGMGEDPLASFSDPSRMHPADIENLKNLEIASGEEYPDGGRYVFILAQKP